MTKILVAGLCLSRNLGGPAMALSLEKGLAERLENVRLCFGVPEYEDEATFAKTYSYDYVFRERQILGWAGMVPTPLLRLIRAVSGKGGRLLASRSRREAYRRAIAEADIMLNMSGISYVGDGTLSPRSAKTRYQSCHLARRYGTPYAAFIQSYGPFDDPYVAKYARKEFASLPFVPARGRGCAELCRAISPDPGKVDDYPDSAIILPKASPEWVSAYLNSRQMKTGQYTVLSPSAVMAETVLDKTGATKQGHIECYAQLLQKLVAERETVFLLPHMCAPGQPRQCDRVVCRKVAARAGAAGTNLSRVHVMEENLSPMQAKALIGSCRTAIVSRYLALVAAVSTATPVVTIGWNLKYEDLLDYYGVSQMAIDGRKGNPEKLANQVLDKRSEWLADTSLVENLRRRHPENVAKVNRGFDKLARWIRKTA